MLANEKIPIKVSELWVEPYAIFGDSFMQYKSFDIFIKNTIN